MTPAQSRGGAAARIQAPTARQALPADEASWPPPRPAPAAVQRPEPAPAPAPAPAPEPAVSPERPEPAPTGESGPPRRPGPMPTSADDREGVYRGVLWAARAAQELGRVLTTLTERVEALEQRLSGLEAAEGSRPSGGPGNFWGETVDPGLGGANAVAGEVAALRAAVTTATEQVGQQVSRLAAEVSGTQQRGDERFTATEARLAEVESLSADVGALEHKLNELGRAQVVFQDALTSHPGLRSTQRSVEQLRGELTTARRVLGGLNAKVQELQSLPTVMEEVAARQFERLVSEMLSLPLDIEGLYREMDSIAERVTAREDTAASTAERVGFVAEAVVAMRQDLDRVIGSLAEIREVQAEAQAWRDGLERRLAALESPGAEVERLYQALARVVGGPGGAAAAVHQPANGRADGATLPAESQRAVEVLRAELDRIRQSIDVLASPAPADGRPDPLDD